MINTNLMLAKRMLDIEIWLFRMVCFSIMVLTLATFNSGFAVILMVVLAMELALYRASNSAWFLRVAMCGLTTLSVPLTIAPTVALVLSSILIFSSDKERVFALGLLGTIFTVFLVRSLDPYHLLTLLGLFVIWVIGYSYKQKSSAIDQVMSGFGHEFRTPLTNLMWAIPELLQTKLSTSQKTRVDEMAANVERMQSLANNIIDWFSINSGDGALRSSGNALSVVDELAEIVKMARPTANTKALSLNCMISGDISRVTLPAEIIRSAVNNLLNNAFKFTEKGGVVIIAKFVYPPNSSEGMLTIRVVDSGPGVAGDIRDQLFKRMVSFSTKRAYRSSGLGLMVARRMVEGYGGRIFYSPRQNRDGSEFRIELPVIRTSEGNFEPHSGTTIRLLRAVSRLSSPTFDTQGVAILVDDEDTFIANLDGTVSVPNQVICVDAENGTISPIAIANSLARVAPDVRPILLAPDYIDHPAVDLALAEAGFAAVIGESPTPSIINAAVLIAQKLSFKAVSDESTKSLYERLGGRPDITVLLAEDEDSFRLMLTTVLSRAGIRVVAVNSGTEVKEQLFNVQNKFDLVILDYHLPDATARELVTIIRHRERVENRLRMPIISLTAEDPSRRHELFEENSVNEVLNKPSSDQELFSSIIDALNSSDAYATRAPYVRPLVATHANRLGANYIPQFVDDLNMHLHLLRSTIERGHWSETCHEAHKMKSIAGVLGYDALSVILSEARIGSIQPVNPKTWLERVTSEVHNKFAEANR